MLELSENLNVILSNGFPLHIDPHAQPLVPSITESVRRRRRLVFSYGSLS